MNRFNPDKLLLSKWTSTTPKNKEKHFLITELLRDENDVLLQVELQAVLTQRSQWIDWQVLRDDQQWLFGWRLSRRLAGSISCLTDSCRCSVDLYK